MRHRRSNRAFIILIACLFCWLSLPKRAANGMRSFSVATLSPAWDLSKDLKKYLADRPLFWNVKRDTDNERAHRLELENMMLRSQVEKLSAWICEDQRIEKQVALLGTLNKKSETKSFFQKRTKHLLSLIQSELVAIPAQVIYRDPSSWSSCLWVNIGDAENQAIGKEIVAKNSPVLSGGALVGVIDYVGKKQARVRLITDSNLCPSVRAARGFFQDQEAIEKIDTLLQREGNTEKLSLELAHLRKELEASEKGAVFAKGELHGSSYPLWRSRSLRLKGIGFNFDFGDDEGKKSTLDPLLKKGDLLVTTGLDGVFPPDLAVGIVDQITPAPSGINCYDIEAQMVASDVNRLEFLYVLPPRSRE